MAARLARVPNGASIFVDANIFVYHFTGVSAECSQFLERCERGEIIAVTGVHTLLEVLHRLMMVEAVIKRLVSPGNVARKLREQPEIVKELSQSEEQAEIILGMGVEVMPVEGDVLVTSRHYRSAYGLMVNDSVAAAMVQRARIDMIASADQDFARIPGFRLYTPGDLGATRKARR